MEPTAEDWPAAGPLQCTQRYPAPGKSSGSREVHRVRRTLTSPSEARSKHPTQCWT